LRKYLKFILLVLFTVFIFWFFGRNLNWQQVSASLKRADPWYLGAAVLIICLGYLLRAVRWKVLLAPITPSSLRELFATTTVGFAAIFLIGRMGEIVRPMWLPMRDRRVRPSAALVTLGLERIFDLAALTCFFAVNLIWFTPQIGRESEFEYVRWIGLLMLLGVMLGFVALLIFQRRSEPVIQWIGRITDGRWMPKRLRAIFLSVLKQLASALAILRDWRETFSVSFWTFTLWMAIALPTWLVLLAFNMPFTFSDSLFIMGFATVSSVVPTPGGAAGAFHTATAASLLFLKNDLLIEDAAAVSIAMHLVYFAPAVFFGLYYFFHGDISIERFRSLLSSENAEREIETDSPDFEGSESTLERARAN
jgi:glycosyltransferase 2 family protein